MAYVAAADFRVGGLKSYTWDLALTEADGSNTYIDSVVAAAQLQVDADLNDDFEPAGGDPDETIVFAGNGRETLDLPRRCRSLTTVSTRDAAGSLTAWGTGTWRLDKSLNAAGTAMVDGRRIDYLEVLVGGLLPCWPTMGGSIELVGKFGWASPPEDVKRYTAKLVYDRIKPRADATITQRTTIDAVITYGPDPELERIRSQYERVPAMSS